LPDLTTPMYLTSAGDTVEITGFRGKEPISLRITLRAADLSPPKRGSSARGSSVVLKLGLLCADVRQQSGAFAFPSSSSTGIVVIAARTMQQRFGVELNAG